MITRRQILQAIGGLELSYTHVAAACAVGRSTLFRIATREDAWMAANQFTLHRIEQGLESLGWEFADGGWARCLADGDGTRTGN